VGEFVPLAIKECLVPLDTFRDFVYMAQDKEEGTEPMMFNENFKERPHLEEGYQDSYYYEVLGEHAAWAFGLNREGGAWDARSNTLYTAQEIASMKEFYQKEYESDVV
jgi:hypothetical protein